MTDWKFKLINKLVRNSQNYENTQQNLSFPDLLCVCFAQILIQKQRQKAAYLMLLLCYIVI